MTWVIDIYDEDNVYITSLYRESPNREIALKSAEQEIDTLREALENENLMPDRIYETEQQSLF